jgi:hypothetical protein
MIPLKNPNLTNTGFNFNYPGPPCVAKTPPKLPWVNLHPQWDQGKNPKKSFKLF